MRAHLWKLTSQPRPLSSRRPTHNLQNARFIATGSRNRLSKFWAPTGGLAPQDGEQDESHALLIRGGFIRQAHSGIFHLLPLGLRVQSKLESLIDKHMHHIGASKTSLSSISTEALWRQSGRYSSNSELLRISDRRDSGFLLSPTHEEEITSLVAGTVHSYKDLPLRLYQVGRKYRDEKRPRGGLLRAKEFMMKDLYTFDSTPSAALETYDAVRAAYTAIFDALKLPYLVADADSGNMGGSLSHEYHFASPKGEDIIWSCNTCSYTANEELASKRPTPVDPTAQPRPLVFNGISTDHKTHIRIVVPEPASGGPPATWDNISHYINLHALKRALSHHNTALDTSISSAALTPLLAKPTSSPPIQIHDQALRSHPQALDITALHPASPCPTCPPHTGTLHPRKAIEVAHTFHLGTRYSAPLNALVSLPNSTRAPMHMGCHGIGISRIIGAVASLLSSSNGLAWPRVIAPFETIILAAPNVDAQAAEEVYDALSGEGGDVVLDDREGKSLGWKLKDADLIGYPIVVVLGRGWREGGMVEVQCRGLGVRRDVGVGDVSGVVGGLLERL